MWKKRWKGWEPAFKNIKTCKATLQKYQNPKTPKPQNPSGWITLIHQFNNSMSLVLKRRLSFFQWFRRGWTIHRLPSWERWSSSIVLGIQNTQVVFSSIFASACPRLCYILPHKCILNFSSTCELRAYPSSQLCIAPFSDCQINPILSFLFF